MEVAYKVTVTVMIFVFGVTIVVFVVASAPSLFMAVAASIVTVVMLVERCIDTGALVFALVGRFKTNSITVAAFAFASAFATAFTAAFAAAFGFGESRFGFRCEIIIEADRRDAKCDAIKPAIASEPIDCRARIMVITP